MRRFKILKSLFIRVYDVKRPLFFLLLLKIWGLFCEIIPLLIYSYFVNYILVEKKLNLIWFVIVGYISIFFIATIGLDISRRISNQMILKFDLKLKNELINKYIQMDNSLYKKYTIGDITTCIENDSAIVAKFFLSHIVDFMYSVVYVIVLGIILLLYSWQVALLSFVFVPMAFIVVNCLGNKTKRVHERLREQQTNYYSFLHSSFKNWKDIKINNLEDEQFNILNGHYKNIRHSWFLNQLLLHIGITFSYFTKNFITQLYIYFIGGLFLINGFLTIGTLLVFVNYYVCFFECIQNVNNSILNFKNDSVKINKVIDILSLKVKEKPYKKIKGNDIVVKNLNFSYDCNNKFSIQGVSFKVKQGEHLAIIGESGSGKSTIAKLLSGQIKPNAGMVYIGNVDISNVNSKSVLDKVSLITQEPFFFNTTIRDNLLMVKADATYEELVSCCRKANIYDFIETLADGMDTIIGENGVKLSGGQKQRLSIARAILQDNEIIIFDESTSALDNKNENDIISEIRNLSYGKTLISIAHRLSSILDCDKVLVLKDGKMVAIDIHENLYNKNKIYDLLFKNQYILED